VNVYYKIKAVYSDMLICFKIVCGGCKEVSLEVSAW
jgi:hypothetical protein